MSEPRSAVGRRNLVGVASQHLTETIALRLPFESLGPFKTALKRFFSDEVWTPDDIHALSRLVAPHIEEDRAWTHVLDEELVLDHGVRGGDYFIAVRGEVTDEPGLWDRVFEGPIKPEATPHPLKVKFAFGGDPAPGVWYLAGAPAADQRAARILNEPDVSDVMVAGDFVTIGLARPSRWEDRLDDMIVLVEALFGGGVVGETSLTRDALVSEGQAVKLDSDHLHLLDPDNPAHRMRLQDALADSDARVRRVAVAVLAGSEDTNVAHDAIRTGYADVSLIVRRMAIDAAGDTEDETHRTVLEEALGDGDPWSRWRAVRAIGELGLGASADRVLALADDADFQVRFEVARVTRDS